MVSLDAQYGRHSGGISFEDRLINTTDEQFNENTPLIVNTQQQYRSARTNFVIIIHILFTILFETVIILLPYLCYNRNISNLCNQYSAYNISLYIHVGAFFLSILFDRLYQYYQTISIRHGYLNFDQQTRVIRHLPLVILSIGNALLVVMIKLFEGYQSSFQPWHGLILLTTIENIFVLIILTRYLVLTVDFNRQCLRPDAVQEDDLSTFAPTYSTTNEIGFRDESFKDNILEKQADQIRYLRERNDQLTRLVHQSHRV